MLRRCFPIALVAAGLLASALPAVAASTRAAVLGVPPPPTCNGVYKDMLTPLRSYADWQWTLVDTLYAVPSTYYPHDLVSTGLPGGGSVRSLVKADLSALANAASKAGARLQVASAFRSYATQVSTFNHWVAVSGRSAALKSSARPGHSEHQLGAALDFTSYRGADPWYYPDWATTAAGAWMARYAWQYGFVMSYPRGKSPTTTCYIYEPWHYRYVGRSMAAAMHTSGLTGREYLWSHMAGPVAATFTSPGAATATSTSSTTAAIVWREAGPVANRSLREEIAASADGQCAGVAWKSVWTKAVNGPYRTETLVAGNCYRFTVTLANAIGSSAKAVSGSLYIAAPAAAAAVR